MRIAAQYSHLNGYEWLVFHHPTLWKEITETIKTIAAKKCKTKRSKEKTMMNKLLFSPEELNAEFRKQLHGRFRWQRPGKHHFYASQRDDITKELISLDRAERPLSEQKALLESQKLDLIRSYNEADFLKNRVALEVQFGKYSFVQFDIFVKHTANFMQDKIDLGVEIVPTKLMEREMSSGVPYYEKHLHEILRQGRIFPPVPLILIGIEP